MEGLEKQGHILKRRRGCISLIFILTSPFQCYLTLSVYFFCLFTTFLSVLFIFHRKNLVLKHLINRYGFSKQISFERKGVVESKFLISVNHSFNLIKIAAMST